MDGLEPIDCRVRFLSFLGIGQNVQQAAFVMHTAQVLLLLVSSVQWHELFIYFDKYLSFKYSRQFRILDEPCHANLNQGYWTKLGFVSSCPMLHTGIIISCQVFYRTFICHDLYMIFLYAICSVADPDPGSGAFWPQIRDRFFRIPDLQPIFLRAFLDKKSIILCLLAQVWACSKMK